MCYGGGNLNLEEKRRENETLIKNRALGELCCLFGQTNFEILKISGDRVKISGPNDKWDILKISEFIVMVRFRRKRRKGRLGRSGGGRGDSVGTCLCAHLIHRPGVTLGTANPWAGRELVGERSRKPFTTTVGEG